MYLCKWDEGKGRCDSVVSIILSTLSYLLHFPHKYMGVQVTDQVYQVTYPLHAQIVFLLHVPSSSPHVNSHISVLDAGISRSCL